MRNKDGNAVFIGEVVADETEHRLFWDNIPDNSKAIILTTFADGCIPSCIPTLIREKIRKGIPVFLINGSIKAEYDAQERRTFGILKIDYENQINALKAGAVHLEAVNLGHQQRAWQGAAKEEKYDVVGTINKLGDESEDIIDLISRVRETYNLTHEEVASFGERTQKKIMRSREKVDRMLENLKTEMGSEAHSEAKMPFPR